MRSSIRSVIRLAIAVGVVSAYQNSSFATNLNELIHPRSKMCFIHDQEWRYHDSGFELALKSEQIETSDIKSDVGTDLEAASLELKMLLCDQAESEAAQAELEACILAARQYEMKSQVTEAWTNVLAASDAISLESKRYLTPIATKLPNALFQWIGQGGAKLVTWIQYPELLPVTKLVASSNAIQTSSQAYLESECFHDWDCEETVFDKVVDRAEENHAFPARESANCFVYVLESDSKSFSLQTGMDPVCPDVNVWYDAAPWSEIACDPIVCYPLKEESIEATASVTSGIAGDVGAERTLPPTLESDTNSLDIVEVDSKSSEVRDNGEDELCQPNFDYPIVDSNSTGESDNDYATGLSLQCFPWLYRSPVVIPQFVDSFETCPAIESYTQEDLRTVRESYTDVQTEVTDYSAEEVQFFSFEGGPKLGNIPLDCTDMNLDPAIRWIKSSYESLVAPLRDPRELIVEIAFDYLRSNSRPRSESISLAKQIRTVGEFLIQFSTQLEQQTEQVSIAKRQFDQR